MFFEDVKMQMIARKWAAKYNDFNPPKKIEFLMSYVVELVDRTPDIVTCGMEPYPLFIILFYHFYYLIYFIFVFAGYCFNQNYWVLISCFSLSWNNNMEFDWYLYMWRECTGNSTITVDL